MLKLLFYIKLQANSNNSNIAIQHIVRNHLAFKDFDQSLVNILWHICRTLNLLEMFTFYKMLHAQPMTMLWPQGQQCYALLTWTFAVSWCINASHCKWFKANCWDAPGFFTSPKAGAVAWEVQWGESWPTYQSISS